MSEYLAHDKANFTLNSTSFSLLIDYKQSLLYVIYFLWLFGFKYERCPNFCNSLKKKLKLFLLKNLIYLEFKWFKCCKVKKVTLQEIICCYKIAFILAKLANSKSYPWLLFWLFFEKKKTLYRNANRVFQRNLSSDRQKKVQLSALEATSTSTSAHWPKFYQLSLVNF